MLARRVLTRVLVSVLVAIVLGVLAYASTYLGLPAVLR